MSINEHFWVICSEIQRLDEIDCTVEDCSEQIEKYLVDLLGYIKSNLEHKPVFLDCFEKIISYTPEESCDDEYFPEYIISFCMHELRWNEVKDMLIKKHEEYYSNKMSNYMLDIISAFDDDWEESENYKYYNKT